MPQLRSELLPPNIDCPYCSANMALDDADRSAKRFVCPACSKEIDFNTTAEPSDRVSQIPNAVLNDSSIGLRNSHSSLTANSTSTMTRSGKLELTSLSCTNCGSSLSGFEGKDEIKCEFCSTEMKILRPRGVATTQDNLSLANYNRLNNCIEILQKAIRAGNYSEGYDYCNKALEINPNIGAIWENKAICAFWKSITSLKEDKVAISNAREIRTFLDASKENDPSSETYASTANAIGSNLATILQLKLGILMPDSEIRVKKAVKRVYSKEALNRAKDYLETMETAFDIMVDKDIKILKALVVEYSNRGKFEWWVAKAKYGKANDPYNSSPTTFSQSIGIEVAKKREILIKKITQLDSTYQPPSILISVESIWPPIIVFIVVMLLFILTTRAGK